MLLGRVPTETYKLHCCVESESAVSLFFFKLILLSDMDQRVFNVFDLCVKSDDHSCSYETMLKTIHPTI